MERECGSLKTRIEILTALLNDKFYKTMPLNPYQYELYKMRLYDINDKLDRLEEKYLKLCTPSKAFSK